MTKQQLVFGSVLLIVVIFSIFQMVPFAIPGNYQVLGISNVNYVSNDDMLNKPAFLMTVVQNDIGEYAVGTKSSEYFSNEDGVATKDIKITSQISNVRCEYPINTKTQKIYSWEVHEEASGSGHIFSNIKERCNALSEEYYYFSTGIFEGMQRYCLKRSIVATRGTLGTPNFNFNTNFNIEIGSQTETLELTPTKTSAISSTGDVGILWAGNLVSGSSCPSALTNEIGVIRYNNEWRLVDNFELLAHVYTVDSYLLTCLDNINYQAEGVETCLAIYNDDVDSIIQPKRFTYEDSNAQTSDNAALYGYTANGIVTLEVEELIQRPVYSLRIVADTLGIVKLVGKPEITNVDTIGLSTGDTGSIAVTIKNTGDVTGSFSLTANCEAPFSYTGSAKSLTILPGDSDTKSLDIHGECNEDITGFCEIIAYDNANPSIKDIDTTSISCSPITICETGTLKCRGEIQEKCVGSTDWVDTGSDACEKDKEDDEEECSVAADCDDGDPLTVDTCEGDKLIGLIDIGTNKKCVHKDVSGPLTFVIGFIIVVFLIVGLVLRSIITGSSPRSDVTTPQGAITVPQIGPGGGRGTRALQRALDRAKEGGD